MTLITQNDCNTAHTKTVVATGNNPDRAIWLAVTQAWRRVAHAKTATAAQHAVYTLLRGASIERAFTPIRNPAKIASNGNNPHAQRDIAVRLACSGLASVWEPWDDLDDIDALLVRVRHEAVAQGLLARVD